MEILLELFWEYLFGRDFFSCHREKQMTGIFGTDTACWEDVILVVLWIFSGFAVF